MSKPKPPDHRPYRRMSETGPEKTTYETATDGRVWRNTWRQVGWIGQTGAFYALDDDASPHNHEPGSFSPLWMIAFADEVEVPEPEELNV